MAENNYSVIAINDFRFDLLEMELFRAPKYKILAENVPFNPTVLTWTQIQKRGENDNNFLEKKITNKKGSTEVHQRSFYRTNLYQLLRKLHEITWHQEGGKKTSQIWKLQSDVCHHLWFLVFSAAIMNNNSLVGAPNKNKQRHLVTGIKEMFFVVMLLKL